MVTPRILGPAALVLAVAMLISACASASSLQAAGHGTASTGAVATAELPSPGSIRTTGPPGPGSVEQTLLTATQVEQAERIAATSPLIQKLAGTSTFEVLHGQTAPLTAEDADRAIAAVVTVGFDRPVSLPDGMPLVKSYGEAGPPPGVSLNEQIELSSNFPRTFSTTAAIVDLEKGAVVALLPGP